MKKLCFGSFISVLMHCAAQVTKQKYLVGTMLTFINPNYDISSDDGATSALARGRANVSDNITVYLDEANPDDIAAFFEKSIFPMLNMSRKETIVHALRDIIVCDSEVRDDCEIEMVNHLTKAQLLSRDSVVFADMLAGLFLYTTRVPSNKDQEANVKEITAEYIRTFDKRQNEISFVDSYDLKSNVVFDKLAIRLLAENGGHCPRCSAPIQLDDIGVIRLSSENDMLLCKDCADIVSKSDHEKARMIEIKQMEQKRYEVYDVIKEDSIADDIRELIVRIAEDEPTSEQKLRMSPLKLEKKLTGQKLLKKLKSCINEGMYEMVNDAMQGFSAAGKINLKRFSHTIKHMYIDVAAVYGKDQSMVFNALVDRIYEHSGLKNREACEILISYFVQSCEVFDEIAG